MARARGLSNCVCVPIDRLFGFGGGGLGGRNNGGIGGAGGFGGRENGGIGGAGCFLFLFFLIFVV